jgi:hypothetical protein
MCSEVRLDQERHQPDEIRRQAGIALASQESPNASREAAPGQSV